jgi:hypothetical protein
MKIFLDMDGVIVDFNLPAMLANGVKSSESKYPVECGWSIVDACNTLRRNRSLPPLSSTTFWGNLDYDFWRNLPLHPLADKFVKCLETVSDVYLATTPTLSSECVAGKYNWVKEHFPHLRAKLFICTHKELFADANSILIDDRDKNCEDFFEAGGQAILVPRAWNRRGYHTDPYKVVLDELEEICN